MKPATSKFKTPLNFGDGVKKFPASPKTNPKTEYARIFAPKKEKIAYVLAFVESFDDSNKEENNPPCRAKHESPPVVSPVRNESKKLIMLIIFWQI